MHDLNIEVGDLIKFNSVVLYVFKTTKFNYYVNRYMDNEAQSDVYSLNELQKYNYNNLKYNYDFQIIKHKKDE